MIVEAVGKTADHITVTVLLTFAGLLREGLAQRMAAVALGLLA
ncbi:hypothetical protein ABZ260_05820 [Streptosporangium sp. NPDC006013]